MWELDHKEGWALKNRCFQIVVLEKTLDSPLDCKDIKLINPKGNQLWIFIGRTDAEAEVPILWQPDAKRQLIGKDSDAGKGGGQKEKGRTEDEMVGWHHWPSGHESEQTPGDSEGQGSLACCIPSGHKELDTTKQLTNDHISSYFYQKRHVNVNGIFTDCKIEVNFNFHLLPHMYFIKYLLWTVHYRVLSWILSILRD